MPLEAIDANVEAKGEVSFQRNKWWKSMGLELNPGSFTFWLHDNL